MDVAARGIRTLLVCRRMGTRTIGLGLAIVLLTAAPRGADRVIRLTDVAAAAGIDVAAAAAVGDPRWSTGCAFGDYDRDGLVDLYVANYVRFDARTGPPSRASGACHYLNITTFCGPRPLLGEADVLYRNTGNGHFTDVSRATGIVDPGYYGFGVLFMDLDDDGWPDIFVANDSVPNLFFRNLGNGTFAEQGVLSGLAVSGNGREQAGMGVDAGDLDGDGRIDLVKRNFAQDYTTIFG